MRQIILLSGCLSIAIASLSISAVKAEELSVISRLIVREGTIVVSQDSKGELKYSLIDLNSNEVEINISEIQLAAKHPHIYDRLQPAVAEIEQSPWAGFFKFDY